MQAQEARTARVQAARDTGDVYREIASHVAPDSLWQVNLSYQSQAMTYLLIGLEAGARAGMLGWQAWCEYNGWQYPTIDTSHVPSSAWCGLFDRLATMALDYATVATYSTQVMLQARDVYNTRSPDAYRVPLHRDNRPTGKSRGIEPASYASFIRTMLAHAMRQVATDFSDISPDVEAYAMHLEAEQARKARAALMARKHHLMADSVSRRRDYRRTERFNTSQARKSELGHTPRWRKRK